MATRAQKIKVGVFLLVGLALVIGVFVIIAMKDRKPTDIYLITFKESVSGLKKDSPVLYKGVPVGKVKDIRVKQDNTIVTRIGVERNLVTLHEGTVAKLDLGSLMGGMVIELSGGDIHSPRLKPGSSIAAEASVLEHLAKDLPQIMDEIKQILGNLNRALGEENADRVGSLLRNADQSFISLNTTLDDLAELLRITRRDLSDHGYELRKTMLSFQKAMLETARVVNFLREDPSSIMWGRSKPDNPYVK